MKPMRRTWKAYGLQEGLNQAAADFALMLSQVTQT